MCIRDSLKGVIFLNPLYEYGNSYEPKYLMADEDLSGNVREKLKIAKNWAELSPKILVVDDIATNVMLLKAVLGRAKYRIVTATGGHEALEQVEREKPCLLYTSLHQTAARFVRAAEEEIERVEGHVFELDRVANGWKEGR